MAGYFLFLLMLCLPCSDFEVTQYIHVVDLMHFPPVLHERIVGGIDKLRQRQGFWSLTGSVCTNVSFSSAAFVGKDSKTLVV